MTKVSNEQRNAIDSSGGVILSAGAGSGKTTVIIDHIVQYLQKYEKDISRHKSNEEIESMVKKILSKVYLMTFTNLAATEMRHRLLTKIKDFESPFWKIITRNIHLLFIGTIHSFCFRLISKYGHHIGILSSNMLSDYDQDVYYEKVIDNYISSLACEKKVDAQLIKKNLKSIIHRINNDSDLKVHWIKSLQNKVNDSARLTRSAYEDYIAWVREEGWTWLTRHGDIVLFTSDKEGIKQLISSYHTLEQNQYNDGAFIDILLSLSDLKLERNVGLGEELSEFITQWKLCAKKINTIKNHLRNAYVNHADVLAKLQHQVVDFLKTTISENQGFEQGLSFVDLEVAAWKLLQIPTVKADIHSSIDYVVVDEFQDTAGVQFEIISNCLPTLDSLFVVGDHKQAIYRFRGGEVGIFFELQQQMPHQLHLSNNYRSSQQVVSFNNELFSEMLGENFQEPQRFASQNVSGHVDIVEIPDGLDEVDFALLKVSDFVNSDERESMAILMKSLTQSGKIINAISKLGIKLNVQMNLAKQDNPILIIYKYFLSVLMPREDIDQKLIEQYNPFFIRFLKAFDDTDAVCINWDKYILMRSYYSVSIIFHRFLMDHNLSWFLSDEIKEEISQFDPQELSHYESVINYLDAIDGKLKILITFGRGDKSITLMTCHNSKGLQYDSVVVLGTSNRPPPSNTDTSFSMGDDLSAIRFFDHRLQKKFQTLAYCHHSAVESNKKVTDEKRLIYVACTRPIYDLTFGLKFGKAKKKEPLGTWGKILYQCSIIRKSLRPLGASELERIQALSNSTTNINTQVNTMLKYKYSHKAIPGDITLITDLSVTRLAVLAQCPRKFYYQSVLGIDEQYMRGTPWEGELARDSMDDDTSSSSAQGSLWHKMIEQYFNKGEVALNNRIDQNVFSSVVKTINDRYLHTALHYIFEGEIKFDFFGQMVSATPDLVVYTDKRLLVIDFKTGQLSQDNLDKYWTQLLLYSYALLQQNKMSSISKNEITLVIGHISSHIQFYENVISYPEIYDKLKELNRLQYDWELKKADHCSQCIFNKICN